MSVQKHPMYRSSYSLLIILTLICAACSGSPDRPAAKPTPAPTQISQESKPQTNIGEDKPSIKKQVKQTVAVQKTSISSGIRLPELDLLEIEGDISFAGSSTVFPISEAIYERFIQEGYAGIIKLDSISSTAGFQLFCKEGKADIAQASRAIKPEEIKACAAIGRNPIEFSVGIDAVAIVVNSQNNFITNATLQELAAIFTAEKWSDVNPKWPNEPIKRFIPDPSSGTFDFFVDKVFDKKGDRLLNAPNTKVNDDENELVADVTADKYAIGFFGYGYYKQNAKNLKVISVEGVQPNIETAESGKYPLARPLFLYSDAKIIRQKPQVGAFLNFYLTNVNKEIERVGYFPASQTSLDRAKINLLKAMGYDSFIEPKVAL